MAVEIGQAYVSITASAKGIGKSVQDELEGPVGASAERAGDQAGGRFHNSFGGHLKKLAGLAAGAFAGLAAGNFLKDSIGAASDLAESVSKVGVVFADSAPEIRAWASDAAENLGQSEQEALEAAGTFGNLFRAMNIGTPVAADMSKKIIGLAGDLASFNNANPEDVLVALKAGLVGETEPLRAFGVNLNEARIKAEALSSGLIHAEVDQGKFNAAMKDAKEASAEGQAAIAKYGEGSKEATAAGKKLDSQVEKLNKLMEGKVPSSLDAATKAQAAYSLIMKDTGLAQGDFARTSDGLANRSRILSAKFKDLKATLGTQLLPVVNAVGGFLLDKVVPGFQALVNALSGNAISSSEGFIGVMGRIGTVIRGIVTYLAENRAALIAVGVLIGGALVVAFTAWAVSAAAAAVATIAATAPIIAIAAGIAVLVAGVLLAYKHFGLFRTAIDFIIDHWKIFLGVLLGPFALVVALVITHLDKIKAAIAVLVPFFVAGWQAIRAAVAAVVDWFTANVVPVLAAGWELIKAAINLAVAVFQAMWTIVAPILAALVTVATTTFSAVQTVISTFVSIVQPLVEGFFNGMLIVASTVLGIIKDVIDGVLGVIRGIFQAITGLISGDWGQFWDGIKTIASSVFGAVKGIIDGVWNGIKGLFQTGIDTVKTTVSNGIDTVVGFFTGIGGRISSAVDGMWDGITGAFRGAINGVIDIWNGLEFTIPGVSVFGHEIGGVTIGTPNLPHLAAGGIATRAGAAVVGEHGAETVFLPQGAEVVPGTGGRQPIVQYFYNSQITARQAMEEAAWYLKTGGR